MLWNNIIIIAWNKIKWYFKASFFKYCIFLFSSIYVMRLHAQRSPSTLHINFIWFMWFLCISTDKRALIRNSEFGQIPNTKIYGMENKYKLAIFARIPNYLFIRSTRTFCQWGTSLSLNKHQSDRVFLDD